MNHPPTMHDAFSSVLPSPSRTYPPSIVSVVPIDLSSFINQIQRIKNRGGERGPLLWGFRAPSSHPLAAGCTDCWSSLRLVAPPRGQWDLAANPRTRPAASESKTPGPGFPAFRRASSCGEAVLARSGPCRASLFCSRGLLVAGVTETASILPGATVLESDMAGVPQDSCSPCLAVHVGPTGRTTFVFAPGRVFVSLSSRLCDVIVAMTSHEAGGTSVLPNNLRKSSDTVGHAEASEQSKTT